MARDGIRSLRDHTRTVYMADAEAYRGTEKQDKENHTEKNMLTVFVQDIEIFLPVFGGAFPCPSGVKKLYRNVLCGFQKQFYCLRYFFYEEEIAQY